MPDDTANLRAELCACLPSLMIESVAAASGQRVVYFARFDDSLIPEDVPLDSSFLRGWQAWGQVVVKVVSGASAAELSRLEAESKILQSVKPSRFPTLRFSNLFTENPVSDDPLSSPLYVSIEDFIESRTLSELIDDFVCCSKSVCRIAHGIAEALHPLWTHQLRYVHRDIKPANVLIKADGTVVVIDLGIVKETGQPGITREGWGQAPLTVDFAAPEQVRNDRDAISFKTDFFALGVLMYRMLSGHHPFRESATMNDFEVATAVELKPHKPLGSLINGHEATCALIDWLLKKEPYERPRTAGILLAELTRILEDS
jgi:serine/threonine protein kinase